MCLYIFSIYFKINTSGKWHILILIYVLCYHYIIRAEHCGTQQFLEAHMLPNITLTCDGRNLIISPKIKEVFSVQGNSHCPTLKEFALRALYVWKTPFSKNSVPKHLYEQLLSGPAASCMQCLRPIFTFSYMCLLQYE